MACFFFQAEDGIRDYKVTGVQTCALPISAADSRDLPLTMPCAVTTPFLTRAPKVAAAWPVILLQSCSPGAGPGGFSGGGSEERRVGKEGRSRGAPYH